MAPALAPQTTTDTATPEPKTVDEKMAHLDKLESGVMDEIKRTYDTKSTLKRHVDLGKACVRRAQYEAVVTGDGWNRTTYSHLLQRLELRARVEMGIPSVRLDVAAKIAGFVQAVKVTHKSIDDVPCSRISTRFITMFQWNVKTLEGQIDPDWLEFVRSNIDDNAETSDKKPISIKELDARIEARKKEIEAEKIAKTPDTSKPDTPEQIAKKAAKALADATKKRLQAKNEAQGKITEAIGELIANGDMTKEDIGKHISLTMEEFELAIPAPVLQTFNAKHATVDTVREVAESLWAAGKLAELHELAKVSTKLAENLIEAGRRAKAV